MWLSLRRFEGSDQGHLNRQLGFPIFVTTAISQRYGKEKVKPLNHVFPSFDYSLDYTYGGSLGDREFPELAENLILQTIHGIRAPFILCCPHGIFVGKYKIVG